eukprot:475179_1
MSVLLAYATILTIIAYCIFIPTGIFYTWKYFSLRQNIEINKRYANIVIIQNVFLTVLIICGMLVALEGTDIIHINVYHPFISSAYGMVYCLLSRLWLYYFDIKYDHAVHENEWGYIVNEKYQDIEQHIHVIDTSNNFFVKYKPNLGHKTYISRLAAFIWFISTLIPFCLWTPWEFHSMTDEFKNSEAYQTRATIFVFISMLIGLIPSVTVGIINCLTPTFYDHLLLRQEFKYILRTLGGIFCIIVTFTIAYIMIKVKWIEGFIVCTNIFSICCGVFAIQLISTKWVIKSMQLNQTRNQNNIMLKNIFINDELFYEFVTHIRHEFSLEILLSFYEMMFFKQYIKMFYSEEILEDPNELLIEFSEDLTKPKDTYKDEVVSYKELKDIAYSLFETYIQSRSELQINISYSMNVKYNMLMNDYDNWKNKTIEDVSINDLYYLYEDCVKELYKYLDHSCSRFKTSDLPRFASMVKMKSLSSPADNSANVLL